MEQEDLTINGRIRALQKHLNLTQRAFAESIGTRQSSISAILSNRIISPGAELLQKMLLAFPQVSADWLLLGKGPMLRDGRHQLVPVTELSSPEATQPYHTAPYEAARKVMQAEIDLLRAQQEELRAQVAHLLQLRLTK